MNLILLQVILAVVHFVLTMLCAVAPLKIVRGKHSHAEESKSQRIISWCNCVSGGVFISTLFVGLLPFVRSKFNSTIAMVTDTKINYPIAEVTLVLGYFMILLIEQCAVSLQQKKRKKKDTQKMIKIPVDYHLTDISSGTDSDDELSPSEEQYLTKPTRDHQENTTFSNNVTNSNTTDVRVLPKSRKKTPPHNHHDHDHGQGHGHSHSHMGDIFSENITLRSILLLVALSVHSVFEGLAMGLQDDIPKLLNLFAAVLVHECMVSFAIGVNLYKNTMKTSNIIKLLVLFCLTIPVGMMIGLGIGSLHSFAGELISGIIQGLAAGTFLYVVFQEIIPEEFKNPYDRWVKSLFLFIGFVVIACLRVTLINQED